MILEREKKRNASIWKSINFTEEEYKAIRELAESKNISEHSVIKKMIVEGIKSEDLKTAIKVLQQNIEQLHYEMEMIQSTQEQHFITLLVKMFNIMEYVGHPTEFNDKEPNASEKAKSINLMCRKFAFKDILKLATNAEGVSDPLCVEEFFLKSSDDKANKR